MKVIQIRNCDKSFRGEMIEYAEFCINKLLPRKRRLTIKIDFVKNLSKSEGLDAWCVANDVAKHRKHHDFIIQIDSGLSKTDKFKSLAHELTHVKQFAKGELLYDKRNLDVSIWKGQRYIDKNVGYESEPCEVEAVANEEILFHEWKTKDA